MPSTKPQIRLRLSDDGRNSLNELAALYGLTQADVIEIAVRKLKRSEGVAKRER